MALYFELRRKIVIRSLAKLSMIVSILITFAGAFSHYGPFDIPLVQSHSLELLILAIALALAGIAVSGMPLRSRGL